MYLQDIADRVRANVPSRTQVPPDSDDLFRLYAVLVRAKGLDATAEDVHDAWVAWQASRDPEHDALLPFSELPPEVRAEDLPFLRAIHLAVE